MRDNATDVEARIRERALREGVFRARLLADPRETLAEELGLSIPEGMGVRTIQERPDEVVIVLPSMTSDQPVSDAELASVAGAGSSAKWTMCLNDEACGDTGTCGCGGGGG